jgi:arabinogalactan endo-1,4-beta-galactosidase
LKIAEIKSHFTGKNKGDFTLFFILLFLFTLAFLYFPYNASAQFANGADIGWLSQMEKEGYVFVNDSGIQENCLEILKEHSINTLRFRVWVNPSNKWSGKNDVASMSKRANDMGFRIMIDFHYSDSWADPGKQTKPAAWSSHSVDQLCTDIYNHTYEVLDTLKSLGIIPAWIQVGNETNNGMLWPEGRASDHMNNFVAMVNSGYKAAKDIDSTIQVIVHISNGFDNNLFRWMFDGLKNNKAQWDIIGMSLYPAYSNGLTWSNCNAKCFANMKDMMTRYQKKVMIVETGYDYSKPIEANNFLNDLISKTKSAGGLGVIYWEPEGYSYNYNLTAWDPKTKKPTLAIDAFLGISHTTGISSNFSATNEVSVYPNPLTKNQNLIISLGDIHDCSTVSIVNLNGQKVYNTIVENQSRLVISPDSFQPGIYFIQMKSSNQKIIKSFTIK